MTCLVRSCDDGISIVRPHLFPKLYFWGVSNSLENNIIGESSSNMVKGQKQKWKDFFKHQKIQQKKKSMKARKKQLIVKRDRAPTQCSICRNPRRGRKKCYLCNESEAVVELDWILAEKEAKQQKESDSGKGGRNQNTLTQMFWWLCLQELIDCTVLFMNWLKALGAWLRCCTELSLKSNKVVETIDLIHMVWALWFEPYGLSPMVWTWWFELYGLSPMSWALWFDFYVLSLMVWGLWLELYGLSCIDGVLCNWPVWWFELYGLSPMSWALCFDFYVLSLMVWGLWLVLYGLSCIDRVLCNWPIWIEQMVEMVWTEQHCWDHMLDQYMCCLSNTVWAKWLRQYSLLACLEPYSLIMCLGNIVTAMQLSKWSMFLRNAWSVQRF